MPGPPVVSPADPYVITHRTVRLWLVGIECRIRQESEDEVLGSVGVIVPSTRTSSVVHFPQGADHLPMGPDGTRVVSLQLPLYDGPPADLVLSSVLVEHDSGDMEEYKRRIAQAIGDAARAGAAAFGVPAEAVASDQGWLNDLSVGLADLLLDWLGAADDPYTPQALRIPAKDLLTAYGLAEGALPAGALPFPERRLERADTPGVELRYNLPPVVVTGRDDGGSPGSYAFYYRVEFFVDEEKIL